MRVVLAGGGTAGHIEPALALADALRQLDPNIGITCLGTERGLETRLVPARGYELQLVPAVPLPRAITPQLLSVPGRLAGAINAAAGIMDRVQADVLVGFGGYVATPAYLAARRRGVPIVVHEANPRPGLANRLGARLTDHVFTGHPDTPLARAKYVGIPLRREIVTLDRLSMGDKARSWFGLEADLPTLLVTGGSQGARSLNQAALAAAPALRRAGVQVLHVIGPKNTLEVEPPPGDPQYVVLQYVDRMDLAYAAADFALCRSGAMTCAELTAVGLPAAYIPLPHGNGEQRLNAMPIVQGGGGIMIDDADLTSEWIIQNLLPILSDPERVVIMSEAASRMGRKDADVTLARQVMQIAQQGRSK
ncbi:undecaprenyldiphospho-muramoylpentapeptide beta-N-acetylglucosaminyltransferase [Streptosporangium subroseum]|jgi:UDP-N-acetylglucosamine--N-acetylmuramyl-(pentapeptide) pyrophosphoryl-undecaprenol N-acetylglucosamine transferase|uniref:UDP-N-acetylglucosamine--N-acetylmuramyl-(pentapeptide) pyrophosphoryl-undecaprenol N-acetylglucosamine transferase n=1 Tax=Streptosporangium subroseum TaxID=106412 RepID=A0A239BXI0_9ACTN|nr:undecaprenyldiphospho-muramoylpentapeptide beta-N-acetylglucosaminyltransferase [Streptosporangium subroseum]SNS12131.1 UDP-N-acetylglucosamine-N-acetylmuramylpentapeptide N-acetylglucosamine transferase [Streptosporangium subroseum]